MKNKSLLVSGLLALTMVTFNAANAATSNVINATKCICKSMFPDATGCSLSSQGSSVQPLDANFNAYGARIAIGAAGSATIFKQQGSGYDTIRVGVKMDGMDMPLSYAIARPGARYYVVSHFITSSFTSYFFDTRNPCA